ncbi:ATP-binding protein [Labrys sp. KB_33_2]|uniref:ATP-binding protein n=1 Tax=unclassified Labrys (in: a-proteobacteria) TaxID=2688601 RepID=UPI003EB8FF8B
MSLRWSSLTAIAAVLLVVGIGAALASYFAVRREAHRFLDKQLQQVAVYALEARNLRPAIKSTRNREDDLLVQVWDDAGAPMRSTNPAIAIPRGEGTGFSNEIVAGHEWRVYTLAEGERTAQIAQQIEARTELAEHAALGAVLPIIILIPVAWLFLGLVIYVVMKPLGRIAATLSERSVADTMPIPVTGVPSEVLPLVAAMNRALSRLQQTLERQRRFISDAAHELRTPLAALTLQIGNLRPLARGKELNTRLDDLEAGARRATHLTNQMLQLARLESGASGQQRTPVDLGALAEACVADLEPIAKAGGLHLSLRRNSEVPLAGDTRQLRTLLTNLIENALHYTQPGGEVTVETIDEGRGIRITDTGPGLDPDLLGRVFERFFRAAPQHVEGTGLGLAIARSIANGHGIALSLANRVDRSGLVAELLVSAHLDGEIANAPTGA